MSVWNTFDPDAFSLQTLTGAINNLAFTPTQIGGMGIYQEAGQPNLTALIDEINETLALVAVKPRNASGQVGTIDKGKIYDFSIPHLPQRGTIMADSVQGVRELGSEGNSRTVQTVTNKLLEKLRRQNDYTIEYHRLSALTGSYIDVNGDATSLFTKFGVQQQTVDFLLSTTTTKVRSKCLDVQIAMEGALNGVPYTGIEALCGATFWDNLITHPLVEQTYLNTQMAASLRSGLLNTLDFGDIRFHRYRGTSSVLISAKHAYAFPMGVPDMFLTRFAPANYVETVNTIGLPYYAKSEPLPFDKGIAIEVQSNPLNICTRPRAVIKLTTP